MITWAELIEQALIGTRGLPSPVGEWAGHTAEAALLKQLALTAAARRAGFIPAAAKPPSAPLPEPDPPPPERLPPCSTLALDWLERLQITSSTTELVRDWCLLMQQRGKRLPHIALPAALKYAAADAAVWGPYFLPLIGERGHWLIARTEAYASLRQTELTFVEDDVHAQLRAAHSAASAPLRKLREQMLQELADE